MTQEQKDLLLRDFCTRLPYRVKAYVKNWSKLDRKYYEGVYTVASIHPSLNNILVYSERFSVEVLVGYDDYKIKPYLFPLSSMTDVQKNSFPFSYSFLEALIDDGVYFDEDECITLNDMIYVIQWCYKNHFDIHGLIPKGLAIDATGLNIY